jgi:hypothetical protein
MIQNRRLREEREREEEGGIKWERDEKYGRKEREKNDKRNEK